MSDKRRDIAEAADRVFYDEGFANTGIDRVVGEADVALGTLYRHFRTRADVVIGAMEYRHSAFLEALNEDVTPEDGAEAVLRLFDKLGVWAKGRGGNGCLFLRAAADYPGDAGIRQAALTHKQSYLAAIERRLLQAGWFADHARNLAPDIFVLLEGAVAAAFTLGDDLAIASARKAAAALLAASEPTL